jgi:hypothetical protein
MDGRAAIHVAGQPLLLVSTDLQTWNTLVNELRCIVIKSQPKPTQSVADQLALVPLLLVVWPHMVSCHRHSYSDTIFGGIPNVLVIS